MDYFVLIVRKNWKEKEHASGQRKKESEYNKKERKKERKKESNKQTK